MTLLEKMKMIKRRFLSKTTVPARGQWMRLSNNDIWLWMFRQVAVIGGAAADGRLMYDRNLRGKISYSRLSRMRSDRDVQKAINQALRGCASRYVSTSKSKCKKTQALARNFRRLQKFPGGPKGLVAKLAEIDGPSIDLRRTKYVMKGFDYFGSKSARGFLMNIGMASNVIALDIRLQKVLKRVGMKVPNGLASSPGVYDAFEKKLLESVCNPLKMTGIQLDQMIFQNYDDIMSMTF
jgi:hypothetical protein